MESDKDVPGAPSGPEDPEKLAGLVEEWRRNRPDLSWKRPLGHHLQAGPTFIRWQTRAVYAFLILGVVFIVFLWSQPSDVRDVKAMVFMVTKSKSEDFYYVVVALPDAPMTTMKYRGKAKLERGQQIVLEELTSPLFEWKSYTFKDPPGEYRSW